ncbi:hypothetical protein E2C01_065711 [Portunus trituberculatus]|uniref:Uncharacterized protein n=1 Tax=Portunus trituberculatus TaxID=210409 RepID=A0A5B7HSI8_PORTR|nr:hypothetical protein [Portunus trituberculatus]
MGGESHSGLPVA